MNKIRLVSGMLMGAVLLAFAAPAIGTTDDFLNAPIGVFDIEYDNGKVVRLKIKGEAEVSSVLSTARANRQARNKALRDAKSHFSRWLKEEVTVVEIAEEIVILTEVNGESSANVIDTSSTQYQSVSQNLLRGIIVLFEEGDDQMYTVVQGWSNKLANATEDVSNQIGNPGAIQDAKKSGAENTKSGNKIERKAKNVDDF